MQRQEVMWGDPIPAALYLVAIACFVFCGLLTRIAPPGSFWFAPGILIAIGIGVLILGIIQYRRGDAIFSTLCIVFGAVILFGGAWAIAMILLGVTSQLMGWGFVATSAVIFLVVIPTARVSWSVFFALLELAAAILLFAIMMFIGAVTGSGIAMAAGWMIFAFGLYLLYAGTAMMVNIAWGRHVVPLGGPLVRS